jgi:hypothetical protein
VAGDRRTRRLTEETPTGQRTLDPDAPLAEPPRENSPPEMLETPAPQHAAFQLEERQRRWFRLREQAADHAEEDASTRAASAENTPADPKA